MGGMVVQVVWGRWSQLKSVYGSLFFTVSQPRPTIINKLSFS